MAILPVLTFPHPLLQRPSLPVTDFDAALRTLAEDLLETMYAQQGIGLAAVQVGAFQRLIVVDVRDGQAFSGQAFSGQAFSGQSEQRNPACYVNPRILTERGEILTEEGCLSVIDFTAEIKRSAEVLLEYEDLSGVSCQRELTGLAAVCVQHEIDHTRGKLFIDHLPPVRRQMVKKRLTKLTRGA